MPAIKSRIDSILERMHALQAELEAEIAKRGEAFRYRLENDRVVFEEEVRRRNRQLRVRFWVFLRRTRPLVLLTAPVIYALIVPFMLLDLFVWVYQAVCFPVYGIPKVRRRDHIRIDRQHLDYLNWVQKLNCVYCGYCNGVVSWVREVAGRTEAYWCPIKHASRVSDPHRRYLGFQDYGDETRYREALEAQRAALRQDTGAE